MKVLLHAPSAGALTRARSNLKNLLLNPSVEVKVIVNSEAVEVAINHPDALDDALWLCPNTLAKINRSAPAHLKVLPQGAIESMVLFQGDGWVYIRS